MFLLDDLAEWEEGAESSFSTISKSVRSTGCARLQPKVNFYPLFVNCVVFPKVEWLKHEMADGCLELRRLRVLLVLASAEIE